MTSLNLVALLIICLNLRSFLLRLSDPKKVENVLYKPMKRIRIKKSDHRVVYPAFLLTFLYIKFIYSEKATKFCEISTLLLTGTT